MKNIVIYHGSCLDGSTAAAIFKMANPSSETVFIPTKSKDDPEAFEKAQEVLNKDTHLYFLDTMFLFEKVADLAGEITILDHHISNKTLGELAKEKYNAEYIFDNNKSGASIAWEYFFPSKDIPKFVWHIEDGDIARFDDKEGTDKINTLASIYMDDLDKYIELINSDINELYKKGEILLEYRDMLVDYYLRNAQAIHLNVGGHIVKSFNVASIRPVVSEFGLIQAKHTKEAVCMFKVFGNRVNLSFRSNEKARVKAKELAEILGGGGHENAAGAAVSLEDFLSMIEDVKKQN